MAKTQKLLIEFGDGESPEEFGFNCTINSNQEFNLTATTVEANEPNCVDPNAPSWIARAIDTLSAGITGDGTADPLSYGALRDRFFAAVSFNIRVTLDIPGAAGGGYYEGKYILTTLGTAKEGKGFVTASIELASDGPIVWVDAA